MDWLLKDLTDRGMVVDIHVDLKSHPEVVYLRFHGNTNPLCYMRGLLEKGDLLIETKILLNRSVTNMGNWRQLGEHQFDRILVEYKRIEDLLPYYSETTY